MKELKTIIVKYFELHDKNLACFVDVKPRLLRYQCNAEPIQSFNWLQLEDWVLFQDKLEELFENDVHELKKDFEKKIVLRENVELCIKQNHHYKQIYKKFTNHNKPANKKVNYYIDCSIRFRERNKLNGDAKATEKEENGFEGFVDKEMIIENFLKNGSKADSVSSHQSEQPSNRDPSGFQEFNELPEKNLLKPDSSELLDHDYDGANLNDSQTTSNSSNSSTRKFRKKRDEVAGLIDSLTVPPANIFKRAVRRPSYNDFNIIYSSTKRKLKKRQKSSDAEKEDDSTKQENDSKVLLHDSSKLRQENSPLKQRDWCKQYEYDSPKKSRKQNFNETKMEDFIIEKVPVNELLNKKIDSYEASLVALKEEKRNKTSITTDMKQKDIMPEYPSIGKLDDKKNRNKLQIDESLQIQKIFELMMPPPPKEVPTLNLVDMSPEDIFSTFDIHKENLDKVFHSEKHRDIVRGYRGNDHFLVMGLTKESTQHLIMKKLSDIYEVGLGKSGAYATLFANALMPEWLLGIFMKRFNFTREQAMQHLKDEEKYKIYLESQDDSSFIYFNT